MEYIVVHSDKNSCWYSNKNITEITVTDFNILIDNNIENVLFNLIKSDEIVTFLRLNDKVINEIITIIVNNQDHRDIIPFLNNNNIPFFSLVMNTIDVYKSRYKYLLDFYTAEKISIFYTEDNLSSAISLAKHLKSNVTLANDSISLDKYKIILDKYFTEDMDRSNIHFYFQENNNPLSAKELYNTATMVNDIVNRVENTNLSQIESIMYVYDIVKERIYKKDKDNYHNSHDVMNVLTGDTIVCSGYSNVFNAILKCLGIKAIPLISNKSKHQRSIAYVKDEKYNIDGVYVFDPTWDSKKDTNDYTYINRYNYFAMPLSLANESAPLDFIWNKDISFDTFLDYYEDFDSTEKLEIVTRIDNFFKFVSDKGLITLLGDLSYLPRDNIKDRLEKEYNHVMSKYNTNTLEKEMFTEIVYNTRKAEARDKIIPFNSVRTLKNGIIERYSKIKLYELIKNNYKEDDIKIRLLLYNYSLDDELTKYVNYLLFSDIPLNKNLSKNIKVKKK